MRKLLFCLAMSLIAAVGHAGKPSQAGGGTPEGSVRFAGRLVYTVQGTLNIYDGATGVVTNTGVSGVNPKFSPSGAQIAYQNSGVYVMSSVPPYNPRLITAPGGTPSFDASGTKLTYGNGGIWTVNVDGSGARQLTTAGIQSSFSPDGAQLAYAAPGTGGQQQLHLVNADGSNARQAATTAGGVADVVWLPAGKILFGVQLERKNYELHSFDPLTSSVARLTNNGGNDFEPSWSPSGTQIAWSSGNGGLWIMNADGTGAQGPVSSNGRQCSWGP